jgi:protein phosphatase
MLNNATFHGVALSDTGRRRKSNEDAYLCDAERGVFIVADGMGGEKYGEVASRMTVEHFSVLLFPFLDDQEMTVPFEYSRGEDVLIHALQHATVGTNTAVYTYAEEHRSHRGMGSTLTAAILRDGSLYVAHVGDSRLYRYRSEHLHQITEDHTKVQEMVNENLLSPEEARHHPQKHVITQCIGRKTRFRPDIFRIELEDGDLFLLCSDGLTDMVGDEHLLAIIQRPVTLEARARELVDEANDRGGKDNITALLFKQNGVLP